MNEKKQIPNAPKTNSKYILFVSLLQKVGFIKLQNKNFMISSHKFKFSQLKQYYVFDILNSIFCRNSYIIKSIIYKQDDSQIHFIWYAIKGKIIGSEIFVQGVKVALNSYNYGSYFHQSLQFYLQNDQQCYNNCSQTMDSDSVNGIIFISALTFCFAYVFVSSLFQHKRIHFIHETGLAMTIGFIVGLITFFFFRTKFYQVIQLNDSIVFFVLLPPMLFSDGFNLKKRRFFQNIFYINIYGIIGTILNFLTVAGIIYAVNHYKLIRDFGNITSVRILSTWQVLLFAACMCSMDDVAALSTIKPQVHPKLFSVIFGQSLMKDAVTIVLFKSIVNLIVNNGTTYSFDFLWYSPFQILGNFLVVIIVSVLMGIGFSLVLIIMFKTCRFIVHSNGITQLGLTFLLGFIAYLACQLIGYSGIISMMVAGIMLSHFNIYNMSKSGVETSKLAFKTISIIAEGLLFLLLGMASWQFQNDQIQATGSWTFILFGFLAMFIGRFVNIAVTTFLFYFCVGKNKWRLNRYQLEILLVSGLVKGAVPFALISTLQFSSSSSKVTTIMLKSTVIAIVFITSLIFNGLIPMFIKWRSRVMKEKIDENHHTNVDTLKQQEMMNYESQLKGETQEERKYRGMTQKYWKRFEQGFIKPLLIYNYKGRRQQIKQQKRKQRFQQFGIPIISNFKDQNMIVNLQKPLLKQQKQQKQQPVHEEQFPLSPRESVYYSIKPSNLQKVEIQLQESQRFQPSH